MEAGAGSGCAQSQVLDKCAARLVKVKCSIMLVFWSYIYSSHFDSVRVFLADSMNYFARLRLGVDVDLLSYDQAGRVEEFFFVCDIVHR